MTAPLDLDAIRARTEAATPGPWAAGRENVNELHWTLPANTLDRNGRRSYVAESESLLPDWEFIAHARTDVPALLAEVDRLRELADAARLLGSARMVLDRCAETQIGGCRAEAAAMAQQIVDLIGHSVTDEPPHALVELERLRADSVPRSALVAVLAELDAEHRAEPYDVGRRDGCVICWPKDGSWPCVTRMVADELRAIVEREDTDA